MTALSHIGTKDLAHVSHSFDMEVEHHVNAFFGCLDNRIEEEDTCVVDKHFDFDIIVFAVLQEFFGCHLVGEIHKNRMRFDREIFFDIFGSLFYFVFLI